MHSIYVKEEENNEEEEWFFPPIRVLPTGDSFFSRVTSSVKSFFTPQLIQSIYLFRNGLSHAFFKQIFQQAREILGEKWVLDTTTALRECMDIHEFVSHLKIKESDLIKDIEDFLNIKRKDINLVVSNSQSASEFLLEVMQNNLITRSIAADPIISIDFAMCLEYALWMEGTIEEELESSSGGSWYTDTREYFTFNVADDSEFNLTKALIENKDSTKHFTIDELVSPWRLIDFLFENKFWKNHPFLPHIPHSFKKKNDDGTTDPTETLASRSLKNEALFLARALNAAIKRYSTTKKNEALVKAHALLETVVVHGQGFRLNKEISQMITTVSVAVSSDIAGHLSSTNTLSDNKIKDKILGSLSDAISQVAIGTTKRFFAPKRIVPAISSLTGSVALEMFMLKLALQQTPYPLHAIVRPILLSLFPIILVSVRQASEALGLFAALDRISL